jgi:hypothetical protein
MSTVFISYSRQSKATAMTLAQDIEALGLTAWLDQEISGGRSWWEQILENVRSCDVFVFLLDQGSLKSLACKREYEYAAALGKSILPILVTDGVNPNVLPPALSEIQYVDYRVPDRQAALHLANALNTIPTSGPLPDPLPDPPKVPLSDLVNLTERVESDSSLSYEEQSTLVAELRRSLRDQANANEGRRLLEILRSRRDFLAAFSDEVEDLLRQPVLPVPMELPASKSGVDSTDDRVMNALALALKYKRRLVWPETRLEAAVRGMVVGFIAYTVAAIPNVQWASPIGLLQSIFFCGIAGAIAGRRGKLNLVALVIVVLSSVATIAFSPSYNSPGNIVDLGSVVAATVVSLVVFWEKVQEFRKRRASS